jgi:hypothetical protein
MALLLLSQMLTQKINPLLGGLNSGTQWRYVKKIHETWAVAGLFSVMFSEVGLIPIGLIPIDVNPR